MTTIEINSEGQAPGLPRCLITTGLVMIDDHGLPTTRSAVPATMITVYDQVMQSIKITGQSASSAMIATADQLHSTAIRTRGSEPTSSCQK